MNSILIIGQLLAAVGSVDGKKKFQKLVHILQHFGVPFHFRFSYLHYGPYSSELDTQLQIFESEGLINGEPITTSSYNTFRFTAKPSLEHLLTQLKVKEPLPHASLAQELNKMTAQELEAISTIYYLQKAGKTGAVLEESFCTLKPRLASVFKARLKTAQALEQRSKSAA